MAKQTLFFLLSLSVFFLQSMVFNPKEKPERITADTLEKLGYTPIKGGKDYSRTSGISEIFNSFAKKENLS